MLRSSALHLCVRGEHARCLFFHTNAPVSAQFLKKSPSSKDTSRTRLTESMKKKPGSRSANLEVAPKSRERGSDFSRDGRQDSPRSARNTPPRGQEPSFTRKTTNKRNSFARDTLPHADAELLSTIRTEERNPSFRRRSAQSLSIDERPGRWNNERSKYGDRDRSTTRREERNPSFQRRSTQGVSRDERPARWSSEGPRYGDRDRLKERDGDFRGGRDREGMSERGSDYRGGGRDREGTRDRYKTGERENRDDRETSRRDATRTWTDDHSDQLHEHSESKGPKKIRNHLPLDSEFSESSTTTIASRDSSQLPTRFTSPPLMPGILSCLTDALGPNATPTPIQALSLKWLLNDDGQVNPSSGWKQFLLASETGSGKSIAYLLPLLQNLKQSELTAASSPQEAPSHEGPQRALNPRALILAPTHELARQLSGFAKALLHEVKLRVLCTSRANTKNTKERDATARKMVSQFDASTLDSNNGEFEVKERSGFPVDVVVGTPMKLLEMVRGRGWDRKEEDDEQREKLDDVDEITGKPRRGRDKMVGFGKWRSRPEMGLANVEWVVVDEADVLFDPDFQSTTRQLLADVSAARGHTVPFTPNSPLALNAPSGSPATTNLPSTPGPIDYPFNLILTSATIPSALASYLDTHHPKLMRLASPNLHQLPKTLQTEYYNWSGGNKYADIERRIRRVWAEDASMTRVHGKGDGQGQLSKILIFCNKSNKVEVLGAYLEEKGIKNIALSSTSDQRKRGSNHHLDGFLRVPEPWEEVVPWDAAKADVQDAAEAKAKATPEHEKLDSDPKSTPHVMLTTSLLSRGLDFSPSIRHVFIVDEPRNMIDFLHRAGRAGRAGERGKVVIFGKMKGRGSSSAKDVRKRVGSLVSR